MRTVLYALGGLAIIAFFVVRQRRGDRYQRAVADLAARARALRDRPSARHVATRWLTVASIVLLGLSTLSSTVFGAFRGRTINLFVHDGELWEQASWRTIGIGWGGLLLTRIALIGFAGVFGARFAASPTSIPVMIAITLAGQMLIVAERARTFDVPSAPRRSRARRRRA